MIRLFFITTISILLQVNSLFAQRGEGRGNIKINLSGKIIGADKKGLPFATVAVMLAKDSSIVVGGITNDKGVFNLKVPIGFAFIKVSYLGHTDYVSEPRMFSPKNMDVVLDPIALGPNNQNLEEVQVIAEKSDMSFLMDKKVFTVGKDLTTKGSNVLDVLDNVPSVTTDIEGNISLRGSGNLTILINGKPSALTGNGNTDILKFIPADQIEKIEVMTNPSAKFDAEGSAGIINIVMKKDRLSGLHASLSVNVGFPENHSINVNLNWKKGISNVFFTGGFGYRAFNGKNSTQQSFNLPDTSYFSTNEANYGRKSFNTNFTTGIELNLKKNNQITTSFRLRDGKGDNDSKVNYETYNDENTPHTVTSRYDLEDESDKTGEIILLHIKDFKGEGHKLETNIQSSKSFEIENSNITETGRTPLNQRVNNTEDNSDFMAQTDYTRTIFKKIQLETGAKFTGRTIGTNYDVSQQDGSGVFQPIPTLINRFNYSEQISAMYVQLGGKFGKFSTKLGLRGEYSDISTELVNSELKKNKIYFNLFPSTFFTYELSKTKSVQLNYSKRISRPRFWYLNPFFSYTDSRNIRTGNPDLNPEFGNNFELAYLWRSKGKSLYVSAFNRNESPTFQRVSTADNKGVITTTTVNHGTTTDWGIESNWSQPITKKIQWNISASVFYFNTEVTLPGLKSVSATNYNGRISLRYKINKTTSCQLTANYRAARKTVQGSQKSSGAVNAGFSKDIWNNKASFGFNIRDIFNTRKRRSFTETDTFTSNSVSQWGAPWMSINFTYFINKENKPSRRRGSGSGNGGGDFME
ncbi:MAG: outer membrane receptor for ferrienterochelin and colicin [Flavobacteriales bacterium]|jgi:outer membrane receptor for ferrienterochelin and colicin